MADAPDMTKGGGDVTTGPGLAQGEATAVNAAADAMDALAPENLAPPAAAAAPTALPEMAQPSDFEPAYLPSSEDDAFITGPSTRPDESVTTGATFGRPVLPATVRASLPLLQAAAAAPGASDELKAMVAVLLREEDL